MRGYDGGKKVKGRKRHILTDTLGLLLAVVVHAADIPDRDGARLVLQKAAGSLHRLRLIWVDSGYRGALLDWAKEKFGWTLQVVQHAWAAVATVYAVEGQEPPAKPVGFQVLPKRWIVERTFAWLSLHRRTSKDYELLPETSEAVVLAVMVRLMVRRLAEGK